MPEVNIIGMGIVSSCGTGFDRLIADLRTGTARPKRPVRIPLAFADGIRVAEFDHGPFARGEEGAEAVILETIEQALADAGLDNNPGTFSDCALVVGSSGFLYAAEDEFRRRFEQTGQPSSPPLRGTGWMAARLSQRLAIGGPVFSLSTACSSSANALIVAANLIRRGRTRRALVVGTEGLSAISLNGFYSLMLLDPQGCRPFDRERRGLQLGEGAAALMLEAADGGRGSATRLCGGANLCDIHHVTSASPDGSAMHLVMSQALAASGTKAHDIVAIKAHGTGSADNDTAEAAAMRALYAGTPPPFTAIKRYIGHTLGACGAMETAALIGCLRAGFLPPTAGFSEPDPALGVTPLNQAIPAQPGHYLLNFFGFGGNYASVVIVHD
ncbi:MAG: beta-ketoacyl synthase N-terminal-like domain-containing protein [Acidiferrobacterales bacterium]